MKKKNPLSTYFVIGFYVLWQVGAMVLNKPYLLPSVTQTLKKIYDLRGILFTVHLPATLAVAFSGLFLAFFLGALLAFLMDAYPKLEEGLYPLLVASQTVPLPAIAPLFILWLGYTPGARILVTLLMTFFPITINLHAGTKAVRRDQIELLRSFGARSRQIFFCLKLPAALPSLFAAMKLALPLSLIGATLAEWLGGNSGLGYLSRRMITQLDGAGVFAPVFLLAIVALILLKGLTLIETRLLPWRGEI